MSKSTSTVVIESRIHLFSALAEAAETEHNLMCLYLFAMYSLKRSTEEGLKSEELTAIEKWRKVILGICLEEMTHLCLVSNIFVALGGSPYFLRPNFPVSPGLYPADFVEELASFDLNTIEHFIFLERPASQEIQDAETFQPKSHYERFAPPNRVMPTSGDYKTVGALYQSIREALIRLSNEIGEQQFFCGDPQRQVTLMDAPLPGLIAIHDLKSALQAIETIIIQGEGATQITDSHFERFCTIKKEYQELLKSNPQFKPGRDVVRNPVMRKPIQTEGLVWITHPLSARYMDLTNSIYVFVLRILTQVYSTEQHDPAEKHELLSMSFSLMHIMSMLGETLTLLPASEENPNQFAGMSFAMVRTLTPFEKETELQIIIETFNRYIAIFKELRSDIEPMRKNSSSLHACVNQLDKVYGELETQQSKLIELSKSRGKIVKTDNSIPAKEIPIPENTSPVQIAEGKAIKVVFDAKKCIHSRHCVTELPQVFRANEPGEWIEPDETSAEALAAVICKCPSGALTYESKGSLESEMIPPVNVMRLYENGPYAFLGDLEIDGKKDGFRATLCRCGQSKRKPFCDHSHANSNFIATGEPVTVDATALKNRNGTLKIQRLSDGPLQISGNVEICAATGRVVLRTSSINLCRCGHSKTKPICDGTHALIGFKDSLANDEN